MEPETDTPQVGQTWRQKADPDTLVRVAQVYAPGTRNAYVVVESSPTVAYRAYRMEAFLRIFEPEPRGDA